MRGWLGELPLEGADVLELAPGTGIWTTELLSHGASVTAVDAAPEMLAELRGRIDDSRLTALEADLFTWQAPRRFDAVVACFFMSHVPDERFAAFLSLVATALRDGGSFFLLDGLREPTSTAADHVLPEERRQTMWRRLDDGRRYQIVKRFRDDDELVEGCRAAGLRGDVRRTPTYFQVALGTLA